MVKDRDDGDSDQDQSPQKDQDQDFRTSPLYLEKYKDSNPKGVALLSLMDKTGYNMVQINGQRTYGGPPPGWEGPPPPRGCEVFVGKIPRDMYEDELVPLFETAGKIYAFRLMMEFSGENRGYAFVMFTSREEAQRAIQMLDRYEIRPNKHLGVCVSLDNCRLFIGSIPKNKWKEDILEEMKKVTEGVVDVLVYPSSNDKTKNRGFAFVEYESHKAAALARRKLIPGGFQLWGQSVHANWAQPEKDVDEEVMQRIRVLFVRNLALSTSEKTLLEEFSRFKPGSVERVKKLMDYGFIHYHHREDALSALELMNGAVIDGSAIEVMLAKPANAHREAGASSGARARRFQGRGYLDNGNHANGSLGGAMATASGGGGGWAEFLMQGGGGVGDGPIRGLQDIYVSEHTEGVDRFMFPILPGTPLAPTSLASLKQSQIYSAQSLLEFLCMKNFWSPPEYHLYSSPGEDGRLLLLYKVVISSTQSTFVPDRLCLLLEDARELAARTTLWSLEPSVHRGLPLI